MDETGWRTAGGRRALWGAFTDRHAVLRIAPDRHEDHAKALLAGTSVSGAQIRRSCCSGVFVDQTAESIASVEPVWRVRTDEP